MAFKRKVDAETQLTIRQMELSRERAAYVGELSGEDAAEAQREWLLRKLGELELRLAKLRRAFDAEKEGTKQLRRRVLTGPGFRRTKR